MNKNVLKWVGIAVLVIITLGIVGSILGSDNNQPSSSESVNTTLTKEVETPQKNNDSSEFVTELAEFKVAAEEDRYTITFPRSKFSSEELGAEFKKILDNTDMSDANKTSVLGLVIFNESIKSPTDSECGFTEPSSSWCFRLSNEDDNEVKVVLQKGEFESLKKEVNLQDSYKVGDTVEVDKHLVTLREFKDDVESENEFIKPDEGNKFIQIEMEIENQSDKKSNVSTILQMTLKDKDGIKYNQKSLGSSSGQLDGDLLAGDKVRGFISYEVPQDFSGGRFIYEPSFLSQDSIVFELG